MCSGAIDGFPYMVAYGTDLRKFAEVQQQLIQAQFELEREYRRVRESEARYRVIYQTHGQPRFWLLTARPVGSLTATPPLAAFAV
jgi:hypothetical protein